ncbi:hypothetical protein NSQ93_04120 [Bacillus sp. FSL W8-0445]|uniref:Phage related protein n=2 Tax=Bacillus licheniformis TaxID=1402 RepID=A0A8B5Y707_BACLI|nr:MULTISPECIES: hypothetical protein [Bacillus]ARC62589.1 hypothetical protein BaDB11_04026 [Bacillus licheniformis]AUZ30190.1 hypothetical protein C1T27_07510 [Bacillus licheniformis]AYC51084.1 hypothetical protein C7M53_07405 [Bacillus licheniformis]EFV72868.1 hypothetical protein HMPREF1012_01586 [Bacillus sp. BT1B_CT2]KYC82581.1 hypothetical protein B4091_1425 [Bacillus licheniformis]
MKITDGSIVLSVSDKAYRVVYAPFGFKRVEESEEVAQETDAPFDLFEMSKEQLTKVNKSDIIAFLEQQEFEFDPNAKKDELIKVVLGEE